MILASTQQTIGIVLGVAIALGWLLYLVANVRRARPELGSEIELAANRKPYLDDEQLEGPRLEKALGWGLVCLTIIGVGLPLYWLAEPGRMAGAISDFDDTFAHRGEGLYATTEEGGFNCAGCHGGVSGGNVPYTLTEADGSLRQVSWYAPSLDDVSLRMTEDQLREVLVYGRPYSPMPAWGLEGGGPMNEQQIDNLIAYLNSIAISEEEARQRSTDLADAELERLRGLEDALTAAEASLDDGSADDAAAVRAQVQALRAEIEQDQPATMGAALFNVNCARCHTLGWAYYEPQEPGGGAFGPPLGNVLQQFEDEEEHYDFVAVGRQFGERYGKQGKASGRMPYFASVLTEQQIKAIVDYERQLAEQAQETGS
jgi:mono/diheme cytochrome c family protein